MPAPSASSPVRNAAVLSPEKPLSAVKPVVTQAAVKPVVTEELKPKTFLTGVSRAPCAPFLAGKCQKGDTCPYNHNRDQIFGTSALDEPSPQVAGSKSKKRQFQEDGENKSPNKPKNNQSVDKDCDQDSNAAKRARLVQGTDETKQSWHPEDDSEGQYWGFYEGSDDAGYWNDEYELYDYSYGYEAYDESWDQGYPEYYECWAEEEY